MLTEDIYCGGLKIQLDIGCVQWRVLNILFVFPGIIIPALTSYCHKAMRAEFELLTLLASAMSSTRATDIHFKNKSNESSRFLLDNEHQDVVNVTPGTVLEGSIYRTMFNYLGPIPYNFFFFFIPSRFHASSETQGQIVGARESLNGRKNMARRKVKNGEKSPWGQCLTRPVPNGRRRSAF